MTTAFSMNIKALRDSRSLTQEQLADLLEVSRPTVVRWENPNGTTPRQPEVLGKIKDIFNVTDKDLFGYSEGFYAKSTGLSSSIIPQGDGFSSTAPVLGSIAAGDPTEAIEWSGEEHKLPDEYKARFPNSFFLVVKGDSMNLVLPDGCYALVVPAADLEVRNGDIAAVKVNGDDVTVKRVRFVDGVVFLEPESTNPAHRRRVIDESDPDAPEVRVLGKVVWFDYALVKF